MHRTIRRLRRRLFLVAFALPLFGSGSCIYFYTQKVELTESQCEAIYGTAGTIDCGHPGDYRWLRLPNGTWVSCEWFNTPDPQSSLNFCTTDGLHLTQQQAAIMNKLFPPEGSNTETPGVSEPVFTNTPTTAPTPPPPKPR